MTELLTAAQMRAVERMAMDSGRVSGLELMEMAGQGVVDAMLERRPALAGRAHHAVILCGPGNNGGDGFVIARLLRERGWSIDLLLHGDPARLPPDAATVAGRWRALGAVRPLGEDAIEALGSADVCIDALFGTGLTRPLEGPVALLARERARHPGTCFDVAVDAPSGLCMDSGRVLGPEDVDPEGAALRAELTVTFQREKLGHRLGAGPELCGAVVVADIGLDAEVAALAGASSESAAHLPVARLTTGAARARKLGGHKYDHGHALVLSGGVGRGGAARLAARAALRIGAGLVTVGTPPAALIENACQLEAVMLRAVKGIEGLRETLADTRIDAVCIGPGFGLGEGTRAAVREVLSAGRATVLDADALSSFAEEPAALFEHLHPACVLTPHEGEFRRLFPDIHAKLARPATRGPAFSKPDAAREAAARAGAVLLFKGADTVVAAPDGTVWVNSAAYERTTPWLATAGAGDVLAGFIAGLLARGCLPVDAARMAAWLHVSCALQFGPGLIAEDLPQQLPAVLRRLDEA